MSSKKSGIIRGLKLLSSDEAWKRVGENKYKLKTENYDFFGKVDKDCSGFVIKAVNDGCNTGFVEEFENISETTKNQIANYFCKRNKNGKRERRARVVYLVKDKKGGGKN